MSHLRVKAASTDHFAENIAQKFPLFGRRISRLHMMEIPFSLSAIDRGFSIFFIKDLTFPSNSINFRLMKSPIRICGPILALAHYMHYRDLDLQ